MQKNLLHLKRFALHCDGFEWLEAPFRSAAFLEEFFSLEAALKVDRRFVLRSVKRTEEEISRNTVYRVKDNRVPSASLLPIELKRVRIIDQGKIAILPSFNYFVWMMRQVLIDLRYVA